MIYDTLKHVDNYKGLGRVYEALCFLRDTDFAGMELGRYELNDNMYYMVQEYETKRKDTAELHEKYIDIQMLISGEEVIAVAPIECDKVVVDAKPEKDVWHVQCKTQPMTIRSGEFMVLYPSDVHMPGATLTEPVHCRKVVVKVRA